MVALMVMGAVRMVGSDQILDISEDDWLKIDPAGFAKRLHVGGEKESGWCWVINLSHWRTGLPEMILVLITPCYGSCFALFCLCTPCGGQDYSVSVWKGAAPTLIWSFIVLGTKQVTLPSHRALWMGCKWQGEQSLLHWSIEWMLQDPLVFSCFLSDQGGRMFRGTGWVPEWLYGAEPQPPLWNMQHKQETQFCYVNPLISCWLVLTYPNSHHLQSQAQGVVLGVGGKSFLNEWMSEWSL